MMRKSIFFLIAGLFAAGAAAYDYPIMTFETVDGTAHTIAVDNLSLSFSQIRMKAVGKESSLELPITDLAKLYFSSGESGIESVVNKVEGNIEVITLSGMKAGVFDSFSEASNTLPAGIYIVKTENKAFKICVK